MGAITRDLLPYSIGRNVSEDVTLTVLGQTLQDDGSFNVAETTVIKKARVVPLTQSEINRLIAGGITINKGYSISFPGEVVKVPDLITLANGLLVRVVSFTVEEGASVFIASMPSLGPEDSP